MRVFRSLQDAADHLAGAKKWDRVLEAVKVSSDLPEGVTYSVGDSLTWRNITSRDADHDAVSRRRYSRVLYCRRGSATVHVILEGTPLESYSDLSDRQLVAPPSLTGSTIIRVTLCPGQLACFDISEATRITPSSTFSGVLLNVTVEGRSFHHT